MRKYAITICGASCVLGAFGIFARWLQNMTAFEKGTGLYINGNFWGNVLLAICIIAAAFLFGLVWYLKNIRGLTSPVGFKDAFKRPSLFHMPAFLASAAVMVLGAILLLMKADETRYPSMYRILSLLALMTALGFAIMASATDRPVKTGTLCTASVIPIIFHSFWLLLSYREDSSTSIVWSYAIEILAISFSLLAFYYIAGYAFGRQKPGSTLFFCGIAAFFSIVTLSDDRLTALQILFVSNAAMLLYVASSVASNLCPNKPIVVNIETGTEEPSPTDDHCGFSEYETDSDDTEYGSLVRGDVTIDEDGAVWQEWRTESDPPEDEN